MGISWVQIGTPFTDGLNIFGNHVIDSLFLLVWPLVMFFWGLSNIKKKKRSE
jgi:hypothetical protein